MPRLVITDATTTDARAVVDRIRTAAQETDGQPPLNDQALVELASGQRQLHLLLPQEEDLSSALALAVTGGGELDLVVDPAVRGRGHGSAAASAVLAEAPEISAAWSHGDHPAAAALAARHGFERVRTLLQLRAPVTAAVSAPADPRLRRFRDTDADAWVALNARVFADHPEQGKLVRADLDARRAEAWHDDDAFVIAEVNGALVGYCWLKIEDGIGEVYVIGVAPEQSGQGLGRALMTEALALLHRRGVPTSALYVEADNAPALALYRDLGYREHTIDVQYRRPSA